MAIMVNNIYEIIIRGLFFSFPYLITCGELLYYFGRRNQNEIGVLLKYSGVIAMVGSTSMITPFIIALRYIPLDLFAPILVFLFFYVIGVIHLLACFIIITIFGMKKQDRTFKQFGCLYLIGFASFAIVGFTSIYLVPN